MRTHHFKRLRQCIGGAALLIGSHAALALSIDPQLEQLLAVADPSDQLEVIVTFDGEGPLNNQQLQLLNDLGLNGLHLQSLPIAGVLATPAQIAALEQEDGIRSIYYNQPLQLENYEATALTGVDRLRTDPEMRNAQGLPYSGWGVGVVINDSGVDGTHGDIHYPEHTVQNVLGQTNLHALDDTLPITYTEGVANTDIGGGHGSHVAGTIGGNGARSVGGRQEGVAPGASLIGYGSGAGLFILDTLGGFDYALTHQYQYNIRVISNSFGSTGDIGTDFDPDNPTNVATKALSDRGVVVVFSAGNSGSGEGTITGNFKKAPWVVTVAAGDKQGRLGGFSSRGVDGNGGEVEIDGITYRWEDRPTVTAPGVDIASVRASTSALGPLSAADDAAMLPQSELPFYTVMSGTSMAAPHVSGIVALMLEANPNLSWREVKQILQDTATNMPGYETWEVGAGYVNAHAAVRAAEGFAQAFGDTVKQNRLFNATANSGNAGQFPLEVPFSPVGEPQTVPFEVEEGVTLVSASATIDSNALALVLTDPDGQRYGSGIALPVLGSYAAVTAPGKPGTWTLSLGGIGSVAGVPLDPLGATNGYGLPDSVTASVKLKRVHGFSGMDDVMGHPAEGFAMEAVSEQLMDARANGFKADRNLTRGELADYLTLGGAARQSIAGDAKSFPDVSASQSAAANAVSTKGAALKDLHHSQQALVPAMADGRFAPGAAVERSLLAYSLVQSLGLEAQVQAPEQMHVDYKGEAVPVVDAEQIDASLRGHVQMALDLGLMNARFALEQGPFDLVPTMKAYFDPATRVSRGEFAVSIVRTHDRYMQ